MLLIGTKQDLSIEGDNTARHVSVGNRLVVTGEYERGEFDAFSIENSYQEKICS